MARSAPGPGGNLIPPFPRADGIPKPVEMTGGLGAKFLGLNKDRKLEVAGYLPDIAEALCAVRGWSRTGATYEGGVRHQLWRCCHGWIGIKRRFSAFLNLPAQVHDTKDPTVRIVVEDTIPKVDAHDRALLCCYRNCLSCTYTNMI